MPLFHCNPFRRFSVVPSPHSRFDARTGLIRGRRAFSLVEVTIALGVVAFAVLPVLGLMSVGLGTLREVKTNTTEARIVHRIKAGFALTDFEAIPVRPDGTEGGGATFYYDYDGDLLPESDTANRHYTVEVGAVGDPAVAPVEVSIGDHVKRVRISVTHGYPEPTHTNEFAALVSKSTGDGVGGAD